MPPTDTQTAKNDISATNRASDLERCLPNRSWNAEINAARNAAQAMMKTPASSAVPLSGVAASASAWRSKARSWIEEMWISVMVIASAGW